MRAFYSASSLYPYLLNLQSTLATLADVSYLWMREFYLELCQRVQVSGRRHPTGPRPRHHGPT